jgi:hypothetical protein
MVGDVKVCKHCGRELPLSAFNKDASRRDGHGSRCRECLAAHFKTKYADPEWRDNHNNRAKVWRKHLKDVDPTRLWAIDALANAKMRAKRAGLPFTVNLRDVMGAVVDTCPLLGLPLIYAAGKIHERSPTLDRKVCEHGYTKDNIAVISHRANRLKSDSTVEELQLLVKNLVEYLNSD